MRVMVIVKATENSEAGILPGDPRAPAGYHNLFEQMGKFNEASSTSSSSTMRRSCWAAACASSTASTRVASRSRSAAPRTPRTSPTCGMR